MKASCPKNPAHNRFVTVAHVTEDWVVNEYGEFIEVQNDSEVEVVAPPDPDNFWVCNECGTTADVEE